MVTLDVSHCNLNTSTTGGRSTWLERSTQSLGDVELAMLHDSKQGVILNVKVHARARRNAIVGRVGDALKLALVAPPAQGRANDACIEFLAQLLRHPRSSITIISGQRSRNKGIQITGISAQEVRLRLGIVD